MLTGVSSFIVGDNFHNGDILQPRVLPQVIEQSRKDSTLQLNWKDSTAHNIAAKTTSKLSASSKKSVQPNVVVLPRKNRKKKKMTSVHFLELSVKKIIKAFFKKSYNI